MHALTATSALAIAVAMSGCTPAAKTEESGTPSAPGPATAQTTAATPSQAGPAPAAPAMGKRAAPQPGELVSPIIAASGGGAGWDIGISNSGGYQHRVVLSWDNGGKRGEGTVIFQPTADGSTVRMVLRGTLEAKAITVELLEQACTGDDGVAHEHALTVTVDGMASMHGCGDLAI